MSHDTEPTTGLDTFGTVWRKVFERMARLNRRDFVTAGQPSSLGDKNVKRLPHRLPHEASSLSNQYAVAIGRLLQSATETLGNLKYQVGYSSTIFAMCSRLV